MPEARTTESFIISCKGIFSYGMHASASLLSQELSGIDFQTNPEGFNPMAIKSADDFPFMWRFYCHCVVP